MSISDYLGSHRMGDPYTVNGREFIRCLWPDCGVVVETFSIPHKVAICPIAELEDDYRRAVQKAGEQLSAGITHWREVSAITVTSMETEQEAK